MTPEQQQELEQHVARIAQILHQDAQAQGLPMSSLAEIEATVREQMQVHVSPQIGNFFIDQVSPPHVGAYERSVKSILGALKLTRAQALALEVKPSSQISPYLEMCCLRASANASYREAAAEVAIMTGIKVSLKTQQRIVHRQDFSPPEGDRAVEVNQMSLDGGNIRLITPAGKPSQWRQYKALRVNGDGVGVAYYQANDQLCQWVETLVTATLLYCLGDGHPGIWGVYAQMQLSSPRREILDWYHLKENLYKVGGSLKRLQEAETLLWQGKVNEVLALFDALNKPQAHKFCDYLRTHQDRIPNYEYYQSEGIPIGSGDVESWVKQIDRRTQISGAQWREDHVPQVLAHRCAYLNGQLDPTSPISLSKK
ncbi:ISKra4 family transposase [Leptodesmis sichuanensis]|uniref:ISKra4 family transposase n=1 Tax=Leptodesmis sichuanensis TaxID=2906798 RepID=UPI001F2AF3A5|nr:ISKra4 family transposase [Leptodesmis sichuanensis]UIE35998.1 ISKra4 family transposase [Leptodesmis sichuanensis A121]UIE36206.1 ISKra4 family transposase [Leptodesmis sichuanensis A121]UIE38390.1 ISKra4 family transposase [Leptodesmis sichuanensis A121]